MLAIAYRSVDVLNVTGNIWQTLTRTEPTPAPFRVRVVGIGRERFCCGNGIPIEPAATIHEIQRADIVILPELWLGPDEHLSGRYPALIGGSAHATRPAHASTRRAPGL